MRTNKDEGTVRNKIQLVQFEIKWWKYNHETKNQITLKMYSSSILVK